MDTKKQIQNLPSNMRKAEIWAAFKAAYGTPATEQEKRRIQNLPPNLRDAEIWDAIVNP